MAGTIAVEVCVIGAGPVGATLAATLAAAGVPVAVVDAAPLPPMELPAFDGRAYAIARTSRNLLAAAGVWDRLPLPPCPIRGIRVSDGRPGEPASALHLHFDAAALEEEAFGWMVEARSLRIGLNAVLGNDGGGARVFAPARASVVRSAAAATITLAEAGPTPPDGGRPSARLDGGSLSAPLDGGVPPTRPDGGLPTLRPDGAMPRTAPGGVTLTARLVVGAEGRRSPLRRGAGIGTAELDYRQVGIVLAIAHERPHRGVALEQFLPNGPFAQLPLTGTPEQPHASAIVWSERRALATRFLAMDDAALAREVTRRLGGHLGAVRIIGRRWSYPLAAMQAARFTDTRLALVGDAAHGIHPIAGQGLNLGFRDVAALAELVIEAVHAGEDPGGPALLARYQAARRPDALLMLGATHALERLFGNDLPPVRLARRLGIAAVDRSPALKRFFARRAMGFGAPGALSGLLEGRGLLPR